MSAIIKALETSLESDAENWETRLALIETWLQEDNHEKAVEVLSGATSLPADDVGLVQAARAYALVGATDQARDICHSALEVNPNNADAKAYIAALASHSDEPEAEEGEAEAVIVEEESEDDTPVVKAAVVEPEPNTASQIVKPKRMVDPDSAPLKPEIVEKTEPEKVTAVPTANLLQARPDPTPKAAPAPEVVKQIDASEFDEEAAAELERIHEAEAESKRINESRIKRDKFNAVTIAVLINVAIIAAMMLVVTKIPPNVPPQIVASSMNEEQSEDIQTETMKRPTQKSSSSQAAMANIVTSDAMSAFAVSETDFETTSDIGFAATGLDFTPSMDMGVPSSSDSKMMFGQKMEGDVLGVILDVSGSMAEFLPHVVREVDKNFKDAPIVYVRDVVMRKRTKDPDVRLIIPDEVKPRWEDNVISPYWFLWGDLPRKAPQRYVDRLIETFKTRPNQFLSAHGGGGDHITSAIDFLVEQKIDSLYIFSDFEDFVDEELAAEIGQNLGRRKIRTYIQPAEKSTDNLKTMTNKIANKTRGRQMPALVTLFKDDEDVPKPLTLTKPEDPMKNSPFKYATPRDEMIGKEFYHFKPSAGMTEITRLSEPEFEAVFYGPEARAEIFLKDENGGFIQNPIRFFYHSWKRDPEKMKSDKSYRGRRRKFEKLEEEPTFDGKEIIWKMVLEDDIKFRVHLYLGRKGMNATYVAEPPKDGSPDSAHISFYIPRLAYENKDRYFGQDLPAEGLTLDEVRLGAKLNKVVFNLPRQDRDRYKSSWALDGFEPGYNTRTFDQLIRVMPSGIRDVVVTGPSFGPREFHARTTSSKILLNGWAGRRDTEPWEGFAAALNRPGDTREKFTKTEAISIEIK